MTTNNYEHYFTVKATITDGVVSFALDSSVNIPHNKPLWNDCECRIGPANSFDIKVRELILIAFSLLIVLYK